MSSSASSRLVIVSNRLPLTVTRQDGAVRVIKSAGGLATGLLGTHGRSDGPWVGWPGALNELTDTERASVQQQFDEQRIVPVELTAEEVRRYYDGFSNGVIWPLFHYLLDRVPLDANEWATYSSVNRRFADAVVEAYRPGDLIWVHDYQLLLVPGFIRERIPDARIGFFLHIPFPSFEVFRILPWRQPLIEGMLGADLIGFHTAAYTRYCLTVLRYILELEPDGQEVVFQGRRIRLGTFPMGIDVEQFETLSASDDTARAVTEMRTQAGEKRLLLGVDRLDYTKGIPRRLLSFERFLNRHAEWRDRVRFVQIAVPSRGGVEPYKAYRREVNELVGRINGARGTVGDVPVHYLSRSISTEELVTLYRATDVMLVTPLRDGMNLVAKEFVASRVDDDGVLMLSEFAGAADELGEALIVNPYDIDAVAEAIAQALTMPEAQRRDRMRALRRRVRSHTVETWTRDFIRELERVTATLRTSLVTFSSEADLDTLVQRLRRAPRLMLLLDYDGTLVPLADTPDLATPDPALFDLLRDVATHPRYVVHIVSGRRRDTLQEWFGVLPVTLWAEHGLWRRDPSGQEWRAAFQPDRAWMERVRPVLERITGTTPGSLIEEKGDSLAWHYRMADAVLGVEQARALRAEVAEMFPARDIETIPGSKVIEVRPRGVQKGLATTAVLASEPANTVLLAIGDDRTDEDMFAPLPPSGVAIHVGTRASRAAFRLTNVAAVRRLLQALAAP